MNWSEIREANFDFICRHPDLTRTSDQKQRMRRPVGRTLGVNRRLFPKLFATWNNQDWIIKGPQVFIVDCKKLLSRLLLKILIARFSFSMKIRFRLRHNYLHQRRMTIISLLIQFLGMALATYPFYEIISLCLFLLFNAKSAWKTSRVQLAYSVMKPIMLMSDLLLVRYATNVFLSHNTYEVTNAYIQQSDDLVVVSVAKVLNDHRIYKCMSASIQETGLTSVNCVRKRSINRPLSADMNDVIQSELTLNMNKRHLNNFSLKILILKLWKFEYIDLELLQLWSATVLQKSKATELYWHQH